MCGIVGYFGNKDGVKVVVDGLKKLEYRGYDSWGIAVKDNGKIKTYKKVGKIGGLDPKKDLKEFCKSTPPNLPLEKGGSICIGHTRWATHGGVTEKNSHPHLSQSGRFAVVHNGIVENYQELRKNLEEKGIKFKSETDTEVIPNLIELEFKKNKDFLKSVLSALKKLEGSFAVGVLDTESNLLIGARKGSPLVLGVGKGEYFLASDVPAFLNFTKKVVFLDENQLVQIDAYGVVARRETCDEAISEKDCHALQEHQARNDKGASFKLFDIKTGETVKPKIDTITWSVEDAEKGGFPHFMIKEMLEQPNVIKKVMTTNETELNKAVSLIKKAKNVYIVACGTALHASIYGSYVLAHNNEINARPISAGEFPYFSHLIDKEDLIIAVSQSGETADVLESVKSAKEKGAKVLSLVNVMGSSLMRLSDHSILTKAGPEICVLSTKAYVSQMSMFVMLSFALKNNVSEGKKILKQVQDDIANIISDSSRAKIKKLGEKLASSENIYAIGRGFNYATALEACLKIKEVSYIHAEGFAGGDLKHGPIALVESGTPVLVFVGNDGSEREIVSNAMEVKSRGADVIGISFENNPAFHTFLPVEKNGIYTPISSIVYSQLLAYYIALKKNLDPDKPRNLAKSVTVK